MGIISIGVGTCTLGSRQLDKDGNVVKETPARWEADPEGSSVAIVPLDPDTMEPDGLAAMVRRAAMDGLDLCEYCEDYYMCRDCIVKEWKEGAP